MTISSPHLLAACDTGIRSRSKSSRSLLFSSVKRRNFKSAMDCLFFFICEGSPTSLDVYAGMMTMVMDDAVESDCWTRLKQRSVGEEDWSLCLIGRIRLSDYNVDCAFLFLRRATRQFNDSIQRCVDCVGT